MIDDERLDEGPEEEAPDEGGPIDVAPELIDFLRKEYDACYDADLEDDRETAIERYNGEPYGDEEEGSSQVVSRDTAETIDYMVISILRTIISGERVVEFVHRDADAAHEATETIMHLLMDEQDGYRILHDWLKSGLLEKTAVAMTYPDPQAKRRAEGVVPAEVIPEDAIEAEPAGIDPQTGTELFRVVVLQEQPPKFCDSAVPNEEFYCSPDARSIDEAPLKGRRVQKTVSDLVSTGLMSAEDAEELPEAAVDSQSNYGVSQARDEDRLYHAGQRTGGNRVVWWHEEFVRYDLNGDGIAELLYVQRSEDYKVFSIDEMDDEEWHPFIEWCPFPMPHRRVGQSLADKVMDLERINTVLLRQTLDGIYLSNNPSTYVHEDSIGDNTIEDLLTTKAGRVVRWKGGVKPEERQGAFDPSVGFSALEYVSRMRETRTGITRLNMGLDEDTLNQTAKGQAQLIARGEQVEEYVARNFANAVARLITKKAKLLQRFGRPIMVPIDGEYREVDPTRWPADMIARARVGLGASRKEQRLLFRREIAEMQMTAMQSGLGIVTEQNLFNSAKGFISDSGLGDVNEYFTEPPKGPDGQPLPKPEKPDPEMAKVQAEAQLKAQDQQAKFAEKQFDAQLRESEQQHRQALEAYKADQDAAMQRMRAEFEAQLARDKAQAEAELAMWKAQWERELAALDREDDDLSENRSGGDLDK